MRGHTDKSQFECLACSEKLAFFVVVLGEDWRNEFLRKVGAWWLDALWGKGKLGIVVV